MPQEAPRSPEGTTGTDALHLVEHPVYFVSTMLWDARARYPMPQKLLLALLVASRKLRHYFQGHPIKVVSAYPLKMVLRSPNSDGRVAEWNIELQAFQLEFSTTRVIKGLHLQTSWQNGQRRQASRLARIDHFPREARHRTAGSCTSTGQSPDMARALAQCSYLLLEISSTTSCNSASSMEKRSPTT